MLGIRSILGTKGLPCLAFYIVNNDLLLKCFSKFFCANLLFRLSSLDIHRNLHPDRLVVAGLSVHIIANVRPGDVDIVYHRRSWFGS